MVFQIKIRSNHLSRSDFIIKKDHLTKNLISNINSISSKVETVPVYQNVSSSYFSFLKYLFLIDWLVYNIGLISVMHQRELTIGVHISPSSFVSLSPPFLPVFHILASYKLNYHLAYCQNKPVIECKKRIYTTFFD